MSRLSKPTFILGLPFLLVSSVSLAHDIDGTLGPAASATDYYQIQCFDNKEGAGQSEELELDLLTTGTGTPVVSMQVSTESPVRFYSATDPSGGNSSPSQAIVAKNDQPDMLIDGNPNNGNGYYYLSVNKTLPGVQTYHITYHCQGSGGHTGTEITAIQNQ